MAQLTDDYLDYLNTSGLLDESRHEPNRASQQQRPSSSARALRPGERLPSWGGGDVDEPLIGPGDLYGPIAAKLGRETADLLVPYLMQSVSRMAPMLHEAQRALKSQRGSVGFPGRGEGKDPLGLLSPEQRARLEALKKGRPLERSGRGSDALSQEMGLSRAPETPQPEGYTANEEIQELTEMVKRLTQGQGTEDIPMRNLPSGQWPREDPAQRDLAEILLRMREELDEPADLRYLDDLLRFKGSGGYRANPANPTSWGGSGTEDEVGW